MRVLRREAVIDGSDRNPGQRGDLGAHVVMGLDAAQHPAAAMAVNYLKGLAPSGRNRRTAPRGRRGR